MKDKEERNGVSGIQRENSDCDGSRFGDGSAFFAEQSMCIKTDRTAVIG